MDLRDQVPAGESTTTPMPVFARHVLQGIAGMLIADTNATAEMAFKPRFAYESQARENAAGRRRKGSRRS